MSDEFFIKKEIERTCIVIASEMRESFSPDDFSENVSVLFKADNLEIGKVPTIEEALSLFSHKYLLPKEINSAVFENEVSGQYEIIRPNIQYDVFDNRNFQLMNAGTNPYSPHYKELFDNLGLKKEFNEFEKKCVERDNWNGSYFYAVATHDIAEIYDLDRELPILDQNIEDSRKVLYEGMVQKISNDKDHEFRSAFEEGNIVKLSALKSEGYMPSHEVMQSLSHPFSDSTAVVVQKLFGIETPDHSGIQPVQSEIKADMKHHLSNAAELTL